MKKLFSVLLAVFIAISCISTAVFATNDITVSLRVEGIKNNLFYGNITVSEGSSAFDVLKKSGLELNASVSSYGVYVAGINGENAASFGGWDGWLYSVNGIEPDVSMNFYTVSNGDSIVMYYGDPYGIGMQYPVMKSDTKKGTISFISNDTVYDDNWNAVTVQNPVTDYILYFDGKAITPDSEGVSKIPAKFMTMGNHTVQIEKISEDGCPLVLRLAPDTTVKVNFIDGIVNIFRMIREFFGGIFS